MIVHLIQGSYKGPWEGLWQNASKGGSEGISEAQARHEEGQEDLGYVNESRCL